MPFPFPRLLARRLTFPPVGGNTFELIAGGRAFYAALERAIEGARREALLETYLWEDDATGRRFLETASAAAQRGIRTRVLVDGWGAMEVARGPLESVDAAGGRTAVYHPVHVPPYLTRWIRRNHRKVAVLDSAVAFTGGFGFSDHWTAAPPAEWWDVGARVVGPAAAQFRDLFAGTWKRVGHEALPHPDEPPAERPGGVTLRVLSTRHGRPELLRALVHVVRRAVRRVFLSTPYFIPDLTLHREIARAARRGVEVRLLLPGPLTDQPVVRLAGQRYYRSLLAAGVRLFEYERGFLHAKYGAADGAWGYVGSSNLDIWSRRFNLECDLEVLTPDAVGGIEARFEGDLRGARSVTLSDWERRPWHRRALERVTGWIGERF